MSVGTVPAAVPEPNEPPATTPTAAGDATAEPGLFTSLLTAVEPARSDGFHLDPAAAGSSAAFHTQEQTADDTADSKAGTRGSGRRDSVWRAWMLAGAERWKKGAGAHVKRLEVQKAQAAANQVRESRQVKVNRSEGSVSNSRSGNAGSGPNGAAGKGTGGGAQKNSKNAPKNGPKSSPVNSGGGSAGTRSGGKGGDTAANRGASGGGRGPAPVKDHTGTGTAPRGTNKPSSAGAGTAGGKPGAPGAKGDSKTAPAPAATRGPAPAPVKGGQGKATDSQKGKDLAAGPKTGPGKPDPRSGRAQPQATGKPDPAKDGSATAAGQKLPEKQTPGKNGQSKTPPAAAAGETKPGPKPTASGKTPDGKTPSKDKSKDEGKASGAPGAPAAVGKPLNTRESRETGYRDGTRAARVTAHVKSYGDGFKDGWTDTSEAAAREKTRLDQARQERKTIRKEPKPVPPKPATPPTVQPLTVKEVTATHVHLGDGTARPSLARGEVRSLKQFERRLTDKAEALTKAAEQTKALKAHADAQADRALRLLEDAKTVQGGDKLTGALAKLHDTARAQAGKAEEVHKQALRSAEAARTVLANTTTRYQAMYQAVVDSPETTPAEAAFYLGDHHG